MNLTAVIKNYLPVFPMLLAGFQLRAQNLKSANDTLQNVIAAVEANQKAKLFVHYDKNVYLPNETIWFTAYRLGNQQLSNSPDILSVVLVKNSDRTIAVQKKFLVTGLTSSGNVLIPDSIAAADYSLIAYTNHFVKGRPDELFIQRIAIKRIDQPGGKVQLKTAVPAGFSHADSAKTNVKFYPEGGDLVAGLPCYVGWEAKNGTGAALKVKGVLLKDGEFIDTVETSSYGMGKFFINPKYGSKYTVEIKGQGQFDLPSSIDRGVAITMPNAIVHDTLILKVASTLTGKVHIVVHNTMKVFYALTNVDPQKGRIYKIALDSLPRGLAAVTIFDGDLKPCAERVFFAHYDKASTLKITSDQAVYGKRKKVVLRLNFNSPISNQGIVSVACVRTNRINRGNFNDIASYSYLNNLVSTLRLSFEKNSSPETIQYIEDVLLVRGWIRYVTSLPAHVNSQFDTIVQLGGIVTINKRPIKKSKVLMLFGDSATVPVFTDISGKFTIADEYLITSSDKPLTLMATGESTENTRITWVDPYDKINHNIAHLLPTDSTILPINENYQSDQNAVFDNQVMLNQVTIKDKKDNEYDDGDPFRLTVNACGDYVGPCGTLNCPLPGHDRHTHLPIKGHKYTRLTKVGDRVVSIVEVIYEGCIIKNQSTIHFDGINIKKEFYTYGEHDIILSEPLYKTTLYWNNQIQLKKNQEASLIFYTGDVKASYTVIVQGIADNEALFSENDFEVK